jgi:ADP-ribose pyrophosphatase YjhB (NUDIX family)
MHTGESPTAALARELREEIRCEVAIDGIVDEFWYAHRSTPGRVSVYTVIACGLCSRARPVAAEGIIDAVWWPRGDLPPSTLPQIRYLLEGRRTELVGRDGAGTGPG